MLIMELPCEILVLKILPAVKAEMAKTLKRYGLSQRRISEKMTLTEAAVSQYISGKRGRDYKIPASVKPMFDIVAQAINEDDNRDVLIYGISQICKEIRRIEKLNLHC